MAIEGSLFNDDEMFEKRPEQFDREFDTAKSLDSNVFDTMNKRADTKLDFSAQEELEDNQEASGAHLALAGLGMLPGVGMIFDVIDAALYGVEGNAMGAGLSLISAIPILGIVGGGTRLAAKTAQRVSKVDLPSPEQLKGAGREALQQRTKTMTPEEAYAYKKKFSTGKEMNIFNQAWYKKHGIDNLGKPKPFIKQATTDASGKSANLVKGASEGINREINAMKGLYSKYGFGSDRAADIMAYLKGTRAIQGKSHYDLGLPLETFTNITKAIARGGRIFQSLPVLQQNEILDDLERAPIEAPSVPESPYEAPPEIPMPGPNDPYQMDYEEGSGLEDIAGRY